MAFRRFSSSKGRSFKRAFRGPRVHNIVRPVRWTPANFSLHFFNFDDTSPIGSGPPGTTTVIVMARMSNLFGNITGPSFALAEHQRNYLIGGIVFDWQMFWTWALIGTQVAPGGAFQANATLALCTDRTGSDGNPAALSTDWFNNQNPIGVADTQAGNDEDFTYPTRIHWRHSRVASPNFVRGDVGSSESNILQTSCPVMLAQGSANLRLRARLNDEQALVFHFASMVRSTFPNPGVASVRTDLHLNGTLYYRVP